MMQQTSLNIGTIGQKLESARQAKGVTVSEAGAATKILSKFIEAMEADDFGALSAPVYAKSFIKMYAKYLGLEPQPLVDEYVEQYAPRNKPTLTDDVRKNLAQTDQVAADVPPAKPPSGGKNIFGDVNQAIAKISVPKLPPKTLAMIGGGVLVLLIIVLSATQCSNDEEEEPAAVGGAASIEHQLLYEGSPDAYLVKPGEIEVK